MKYALVTGAASGIGYNISHYLAHRSYTVYAGVRKEEDFSLFSHSNISPILLDVTNLEQVEEAATSITQLDVLVNNAGIGPLGYMTSFSDEDMKYLFDVNVHGPWRLSKAFVPHLDRSNGCIVNVGSMGGMVNKPLFGPYSMTKFALEALTDVLHAELTLFDIHVAIVQPGAVTTGIGERSMPSVRTRLQNTLPPFDTHAKNVLEALDQPSPEYNPDIPEGEQNRKYSDPEYVSERIFKAITDRGKKYRYLVGSEWEGNRVLNELMTKLIEENDNPSNNYVIEDLIERLKAHALQYHEENPPMNLPKKLATHLLGVGGLIIHEDKVLLVKLKYGAATELWLIPGGFVEKGETLDEALKREILEETNLEILPVSILGVRSLVRGSDNTTDVYSIFSCSLVSDPKDTRKQDSEIAEIQWFDLDDLENHKDISAYTLKVIEMALANQGLRRDIQFDTLAKSRINVTKYEQYWQ